MAHSDHADLNEILPELGLVIMEMEASMMHWSDDTSEDLREATEKIRRWMEARGIDLEAQHGTDIDQIPIFTESSDPGYQP